MLILTSSTLNLGSNALRIAMPNAQNLSVLHLFNTNYVSGGTVQNLAAIGANASSVTGAPTFDALGMTVNTIGDGVLSSYHDIQSDFTFYCIVECLDNLQGNGTTPVLVTTTNQDGGAPLTGAKGLNFTYTNAATNNTISSVARSGSTVTIVMTGAPVPAFSSGQYVTVSGVTLDPTMNGLWLVTVVNSTTFTFTLAGSTISTTAVSGATCWNGVGKPTFNDYIDQPSGVQNISSISRTGSTVTMVVASAIAGLTTGGPVAVLGVTGDTSFNGIFTTLSVSGTTITYTSVGSADSGTVSGATAGLANLVKTSTLVSSSVVNTPRFLAVTVSAASGVRTVFDMSAGGSSASTTNVGARLGTEASNLNQAFQFGSGLYASFFGKCKMYAAGVHVGTALTQAQLQQNYTTLHNLTGLG